MKDRKKLWLKSLLLMGILSSISYFQAWGYTQSFTLNPGWNSVYLEVDPDQKTWDGLFGQIPVSSIWAWNSQIESSVEYIQDAAESTVSNPPMVVGIPESKAESFLSNLFVAQGGRPYLIKLEGDQSVSWNVEGTPTLPNVLWKSNSLNFVGFHLEPGNEPFFQAFFETSEAQANQDIFRLGATGNWEKVLDPATTQMKSGEAYWIYSKEASNYVGPLVLNVPNGRNLDFGDTISELSIDLKNLQANESVTVSNSENAPLFEWKGYSDAAPGWAALTTLSVPATSEENVTVRLGLNRSSMDMDTEEVKHIEIKDNAGMQINLPIKMVRSNRYGLWVGSTLIQKVSQPSSISDASTPLNTASDFKFPIILHHNAQGGVSLLREVFQMWKDGTTTTDSETGYEYVETPGHPVLVSDPSLLSLFEGSAIRNGKAVGRRISSAAFSFSEKQTMTGSFGGTLSLSYTVTSEAPTNPFKHKYHPDHNNLDERYENPVEEAYPVTRTIALQFTGSDPGDQSTMDLFNVGWSDRELGGVYTETIVGLHKDPIHIEGSFKIQRISKIDELNDGIQ